MILLMFALVPFTGKAQEAQGPLTGKAQEAQGPLAGDPIDTCGTRNEELDSEHGYQYLGSIGFACNRLPGFDQKDTDGIFEKQFEATPGGCCYCPRGTSAYTNVYFKEEFSRGIYDVLPNAACHELGNGDYENHDGNRWTNSFPGKGNCWKKFTRASKVLCLCDATVANNRSEYYDRKRGMCVECPRHMTLNFFGDGCECSGLSGVTDSFPRPDPLTGPRRLQTEEAETAAQASTEAEASAPTAAANKAVTPEASTEAAPAPAPANSVAYQIQTEEWTIKYIAGFLIPPVETTTAAQNPGQNPGLSNIVPDPSCANKLNQPTCNVCPLKLDCMVKRAIEVTSESGRTCQCKPGFKWSVINDQCECPADMMYLDIHSGKQVGTCVKTKKHSCPFGFTKAEYGNNCIPNTPHHMLDCPFPNKWNENTQRCDCNEAEGWRNIEPENVKNTTCLRCPSSNDILEGVSTAGRYCKCDFSTTKRGCADECAADYSWWNRRPDRLRYAGVPKKYTLQVHNRAITEVSIAGDGEGAAVSTSKAPATASDAQQFPSEAPTPAPTSAPGESDLDEMEESPPPPTADCAEPKDITQVFSTCECPDPYEAPLPGFESCCDPRKEFLNIALGYRQQKKGATGYMASDVEWIDTDIQYTHCTTCPSGTHTGWAKDVREICEPNEFSCPTPGNYNECTEGTFVFRRDLGVQQCHDRNVRTTTPCASYADSVIEIHDNVFEVDGINWNVKSCVTRENLEVKEDESINEGNRFCSWEEAVWLGMKWGIRQHGTKCSCKAGTQKVHGADACCPPEVRIDGILTKWYSWNSIQRKCEERTVPEALWRSGNPCQVPFAEVKPDPPPKGFDAAYCVGDFESEDYDHWPPRDAYVPIKHPVTKNLVCAQCAAPAYRVEIGYNKIPYCVCNFGYSEVRGRCVETSTTCDQDQHISDNYDWDLMKPQIYTSHLLKPPASTPTPPASTTTPPKTGHVSVCLDNDCSWAPGTSLESDGGILKCACKNKFQTAIFTQSVQGAIVFLGCDDQPATYRRKPRQGTGFGLNVDGENAIMKYVEGTYYPAPHFQCKREQFFDYSTEKKHWVDCQIWTTEIWSHESLDFEEVRDMMLLPAEGTADVKERYSSIWAYDICNDRDYLRPKNINKDPPGDNDGRYHRWIRNQGVDYDAHFGLTLAMVQRLPLATLLARSLYVTSISAASPLHTSLERDTYVFNDMDSLKCGHSLQEFKTQKHQTKVRMALKCVRDKLLILLSTMEELRSEGILKTMQDILENMKRDCVTDGVFLTLRIRESELPLFWKLMNLDANAGMTLMRNGAAGTYSLGQALAQHAQDFFGGWAAESSPTPTPPLPAGARGGRGGNRRLAGGAVDEGILV